MWVLGAVIPNLASTPAGDDFEPRRYDPRFQYTPSRGICGEKVTGHDTQNRLKWGAIGYRLVQEEIQNPVPRK